MALNDDNDDDLECVPAGEEWLTCAQAAERVGRSKRWVQVRAEDGSLTSRVVGRGRQYLASSLDALIDNVSDSTAGEKPDVWLLTQTQKHAARSTELLMQGLRFIVETDQQRASADREEMARLRARITELETKVTEQQAAHEAALSEQTARFLAEAEMVAKTERNKMLLEKLFQYVPKLIGNQRVTQLIASLTDDQMALAKAVTTELQFSHLEGIHNEFKQQQSQPQQQQSQQRDRAGDSVRDTPASAEQPRGDTSGREGPVDETGGSVPKD